MNLYEDYNFNNKPIVEKGVLEEEIKTLINNFFKLIREEKKS